jgi:histidine ammonia-lyase
MAPLAARRTAEMVALGERIVAVELLVACQAVDLRGGRLGAGTAPAYEEVRQRLPFKRETDPIPPSLEPLVELVRSGRLSPGALSMRA